MAAATSGPSSNHHRPRVGTWVFTIIPLLALFLFLPLFFTITSAGDHGEGRSDLQRQMVLGSQPPACADKCMSCRPCVATLVVPSNHHHYKTFNLNSHRNNGNGDDDTYYPLSWRCRCGNHLFHP